MVCSLPLKNQLLHWAGIQARVLIDFYVLFTRASIQTIGVARIFDWGGKPQITCNDVLRNFYRGIFCGGKDIVEWKIRSPGLILARYWKVVQRRRLKPIAKMQKCLNWETCWVKKCTVISTYHWRGCGGGAPSRRRLWGSAKQFFVIFWKQSCFNTILDHILHVLRAIWKY